VAIVPRESITFLERLMRRWLLFVHRWLGLTIGFVFAVASLTGAILVYETPLDAWLGGPRFATTEGRANLSVIEAAARAKWPDGRIVRVDWPTPAANVFRVQVRDGRLRQNVVLDGGSGAVLQPRPVNRFLRLARTIHVSLTLGRTGSRLVYYSTVAAVAGILIGIVLWWPGIARLATGFRVRLRRDTYILNFDLHQVMGILAMPLLLVMGLSAALARQPRAVDAVTRLLHGAPAAVTWDPIESRSSAVEPGTQPGLETIANAALRVSGGGDVMRVTFPESDKGAIEAWVTGAPGVAPGDSLFIAFDRATGEPLRRRIGAKHLRFNRGLNDRLHQARVGGPVVRALYALSCLVGFLLLPTGITMWWIRRRRKAKAAARRAPVSETAAETG
jgi:uncharacterized iron-regulated membrane protein